MECILPDGNKIEYQLADAVAGPGNCFGLLHCNSNVLFIRVNGGKWTQSHEFRNAHSLSEWVLNCQTLAEFNLAMEK